MCTVRNSPFPSSWNEKSATKLRWGLTADQTEANALKGYAEACETTIVHFTPPRN
ncbi:hypothetical protein ACFQ7N_19530 [Streptomyces niveus]|uniref:hypothetical protein n=1 Tax=Streptomyces niveus TaxID=193462 RepID=UPI00368D181C